MKTSKKIMALALTGALAASSVSVVSVSAEPKKATIGVCFYYYIHLVFKVLLDIALPV